MTYTLPDLPYSYDALEPYIDEATMKIHHSKHHKSYCEKFNKALEKHPEWAAKQPQEVIKEADKLPKDIKTAVINNGGGFVNHNLFWEILKKNTTLTGDIKIAIEQKFGSYEEFKKEFSTAALTQFGSGWAWLVVNENKELEIMKTSNQDSPLTQGKTPILNIDVWEHAYYLKYQNKRPEYVENFFNIINWDQVNYLYRQAIQ